MGLKVKMKQWWKFCEASHSTKTLSKLYGFLLAINNYHVAKKHGRIDCHILFLNYVLTYLSRCMALASQLILTITRIVKAIFGSS